MERDLIVLDIGILMGSRSPQIFMEHVELYPGARKIYDAIASAGCHCGDPMCSQNCFQVLITMDGEATRGEAAMFITFVDNHESIVYEDLRKLQQEFYHENLVPRLNEENKKNSLDGLLGSQFVGRVVNGRLVSLVAPEDLGPESSFGDLGYDEPEHGGPPEERSDDT